MKRQGLGTFDFEKLITVDLAKETLTAEAYDKICEGNTVRLKADVFATDTQLQMKHPQSLLVLEMWGCG